MRAIKRIAREDAEKMLFADPAQERIERRLAEVRNKMHALKLDIAAKPTRADFILSEIRQFTLELEAAAASSR